MEKKEKGEEMKKPCLVSCNDNIPISVYLSQGRQSRLRRGSDNKYQTRVSLTTGWYLHLVGQNILCREKVSGQGNPE